MYQSHQCHLYGNKYETMESAKRRRISTAADKFFFFFFKEAHVIVEVTEENCSNDILIN